MTIPRRAPMKHRRRLAAMVQDLPPAPEFARNEEAKAKVVSMLLAGHTQASAAQQAGVHTATITRWRREDEQFAALLEAPSETANNLNRMADDVGKQNSQLRKAADVAILRYKLQGIAATAIDVLGDLLHSDDDRVRLGAAREVLDRTGLIRSSEVTVTGSIAAQMQPTMIIEALQSLGLSHEEIHKSLPVDATVLATAESSADSDAATSEQDTSTDSWLPVASRDVPPDGA